MIAALTSEGENMTAELEGDAQLQIGHVLFMDVVGFSKLLVDEQTECSHRLNQIVRNTEQFRAGEAAGKLIRLPTGDGMILVFFTSPEAPVHCAMEIARALKSDSGFGLRMGIHSGPVNKVSDVNDRWNLAGGGINTAQRVMDCGDAGHILISRRLAEDLEQHSKWRPHLQHLGECEVKHGVKIDIVNLYTSEIGNPAMPEKLKNQVSTPTRVARFGRLLIVAAIVTAVGLLGVWFFLQRAERESGVRLATFPGKSIAVLPFKPLVATTRDEVLEAGMADTLIAKLSTSRTMIVPSLMSVRKYDDQKHDSVATGRALGVNSVLEGSLQKSADRIRVTARLIKVADGSSMWAGTFDKKFTDVFEVQDEIAQKITTALAVPLDEQDRQRLTRHYTGNTEAYQLYLQGRYHWNKFTPEGFHKSIAYFRKALERDPEYALAYAGLADSYSLLGELSAGTPKELFPEARLNAKKALQLDELLAEAHLSLGIVQLFYDWDPPAAQKELQRAKELNPSDPQVYHFYGHYLEFAGRFEDAAAELKRGVDLDPTNLILNAEYGWAHYIQHKYDAAIAQYRKTLELDPSFIVASLWIAQAYEQKGMYQEAGAELARAQKVEDWSWIVAEIGCVDAFLGKPDEARKVLAQLKERSVHEYIDQSIIALIPIALGDKDQAFAWLEQGFHSRASNLPWMKMDPKYDPLRSDPRFAELTRRIGVE